MKKTSSSLNQLLILRTVAYISKLLFPKYPCHFFSIFCVVQLLKKYKKIMKPEQLKLLLKPIPNKLYELLIEDELIKTEHIAFVTENTFELFVKEQDFEWMNLIIGSVPNKQQDTQLIKIKSWDKCDLNSVFVKENFYENIKENFQLKEKTIRVNIQDIPNSSNFPKIATKASISVFKVPYELTSEIIDIIISKHFECPRLVHRNYLYEIAITESLLGSHYFSKNFQNFSHIKKIYYKIVNLESKSNDFEFYGIIAKNFTNLVQSNSINAPFLPKQNLHDICFIPAVPFGLQTYFNDLRSCFVPFLSIKSDVKSINMISKTILPIFLIQGERGSGKYTILHALAKNLGIQIYLADCAEISSQVLAQTETKLKNIFHRPNICEPLIICFHNFELFGIDHDGNEDLRLISTFQSEINELYGKEYNYPIFITCLFNNKDIHPMIQRIFLEIIKISPPSKFERNEMLKWLEIEEEFFEMIFNNIFTVPLTDGTQNQLNLLENDHILETVANSTQGFLFGDLKLLINNSKKYMKSINQKVLRYDHIYKTLNKLQLEFADSLGSPKVPKVLWSDIGGLANLKEEIQSSIGLPLKHIHLMGQNMKRSGILLYGPPGTGKTLVAKAVATECSLSFLSVQGPELLNMYVGQSEQNVREIFERARSAAPCVIFLDELDSLAPNRGAAGDSGGVMDRVVSQLLAEMDIMSKDPQKQIFILAATNRPDLIDPALLRPGRFDKLFYVAPCITFEEKLSVLKAITNKFNFDEQLRLESVPDLLKYEMSGADLYSICSNAWLGGVRRTIMGNIHNKDSSKVIVNIDDFKQSIEKFVPSITKRDLENYNKLKTNYSYVNNKT